MIGVWMLYTVVVAALLGGAAALVERALRLRGWPARGVWGAALAGSWVVPVLTLFRPPQAGPVAAAPEPVIVENPELLGLLLEGAGAAPAAPHPWLGALGDALLLGWGVLAVAGLALFALALRRMATRSRRWPRKHVQGEPVRVAPDFGPAVVGLHRPEIVLPGWVLELGQTAQHLVVRHEREHREARDTLLLAAGTVATLAAPWNPALWWQLRRLRLAVELDCDARVLAAGVSRRSYGDLLLSVGERLGGSVVPVAALAEPPSFLERRMKMITEGRRDGSVWKVGAGLMAAGVLVAVACQAPGPSVAEEESAEPVAEVFEAREVEERSVELSEARAEVAAELEGEYRARYRELEERQVRAALEETAAEAAVAADAEREIGNSISLITAEEIESLPRENLKDILRGRARGVTVTGTTSQSGPGARVMLRGVRSVPARDDEPLVYVDGVRMLPGVRGGARAASATGLPGLDPDDIDRIEVIKGTAARTLYGEEASSGVIQIFTKEGDGPDGDLGLKKRLQVDALLRSLMESAGHVKRLLTDWATDDARERTDRVEESDVREVAEGGAAQAGPVEAITLRETPVEGVTATRSGASGSVILRTTPVWEGTASGALGTFTVRGTRSSSAGGEPLILVDGKEWTEGMEAIEPDQIERIEIIKSNAARELYGERAANGVIQIFLKEG